MNQKQKEDKPVKADGMMGREAELKHLEAQFSERLSGLERKEREETAWAGRLDEAKRSIETRLRDLENTRAERIMAKVELMIQEEMTKK